MKVVFDTNIFISAFVIPGGKAEEAFLYCLQGKFALYSSVAILTETAQKLKEKFGWYEDRITQLLKLISRIAIILKTKPHLHIVQDEPDNRILECAIQAKADYIVTGDKHLLTQKKIENIPIIRLSAFLDFFKE